MKIVISIFSLPYEIDDLEKTLNQLKLSSKYISKNTEWYIDVTLGMSSDLIDWKKSSIPKQYFIDKFLYLETILSNHYQVEFDTDEKINGS